VIGYGRSNLTNKELRVRVGHKFSNDPQGTKFLQMCSYQRGSYNNVEDFELLQKRISGFEVQNLGCEGKGNRMFYLALPPTLFGSVSRCLKQVAMSDSG